MKYKIKKRVFDSEDPIARIPDDLNENPNQEESRNDHDGYYGDGFDDSDDFKGK